MASRNRTIVEREPWDNSKSRLSAVYQDTIDAVSFVVFERVQAGEPLTLHLCRQVVAELGSTANPERVHFQCQQWHARISHTRRLSQR